MSTRERFERICRFEKPDRPPRWETYGFWKSTIARWHAEGMPAEIDAGSIRGYFGMDRRPVLPVNSGLTLPPLFQEFMLPYYREYISCCKTLGIKHFMVDSDGNNDVLLPLFIEAGVNIFSPFEVPAGNDVREVRKRYPELVIAGGIDKRSLFEDFDAIRREVDRVVPWMWERGGYFPSLDHSTPPNVPLKNWEFYLQYIRSLFA